MLAWRTIMLYRPAYQWEIVLQNLDVRRLKHMRAITSYAPTVQGALECVSSVDAARAQWFLCS